MTRELALGRIYKHYTGKYYLVKSLVNGLVISKNLETGEEFEEPIHEFLESKVPENYDGKSKQDYCYERADHIREIDSDVATLVDRNDGFCPCKIHKNDSTKCMCEEFRSSMLDNTCHCGRYKKTWLGEQM